MAKTKCKTVQKTEIVRTTEMYTKDLLGILNLDDTHQKVSIHVSVPGGGDWSNTDLDLEEYPLIITIVTTDVEEW
jgi:ribosomal protein S9